MSKSDSKKSLRDVLERKASVQRRLHDAQTEFNDLLKEVKRYNDSIHSCLRREVDTVRSLSSQGQLTESLVRHVICTNGVHSKKKVKCGGIASEHPPKKDGGIKKRKKNTAIQRESSSSGSYKKPSLTESKLDKQKRKKSTSNELVEMPRECASLLKSCGDTPFNNKPTAKALPPGKVVGAFNGNPTEPRLQTTDQGSSKCDVQLIAVVDSSVNPPRPRYVAKLVPEATAMLQLGSTGGVACSTHVPHPHNTRRSFPYNVTVQSAAQNAKPGKNAASSAHNRSSTHNTKLRKYIASSDPTPVGSPAHSTKVEKNTSSSAHNTKVNSAHSDPTCVTPVRSIASSTHNAQIGKKSVSSTHVDPIHFGNSSPNITPAHAKGANSAHNIPTHNSKALVGKTTTHIQDVKMNRIRKKSVSTSTHNADFASPTHKAIALTSSTHSSSAIHEHKVAYASEVNTTTKQTNPPATATPSFKCVHSGCSCSFPRIELLRRHDLEVHKRIFHSDADKKNSNSADGSGKKGTSNRTSKNVSTEIADNPVSVGSKRSRSCSTFEEVSHPKAIKLDAKLSNTITASVATAPRRHFARKSTKGTFHFVKRRRRITNKVLQLKLNKISLAGFKLHKKNLVKDTHQVGLNQDIAKCAYTSSLDQKRNARLLQFRNHILSQLNLPPSANSAKSDSISMAASDSSSPPVSSSSGAMHLEVADDRECSRVIPFIGQNCARTKAFSPEVFKPKIRLIVQPALSVSSMSSISIERSCTPSSQSQSEDEWFPVIVLPANVGAQLSAEKCKSPRSTQVNNRKTVLPKSTLHTDNLPQSTPGRETKSGQPQSTPGRETKSGQAQSTLGRETKSGQPHGREMKSAQPQSTPGRETKSGQPQSTLGRETKSGQPQSTLGRETKSGQPHGRETKSGQPHGRETKCSQTHGRETKSGQPHGREMKSAQPQSTPGRETKSSQPQSTLGRETNYGQPQWTPVSETRSSLPQSTTGSETTSNQRRSAPGSEIKSNLPRSIPVGKTKSQFVSRPGRDVYSEQPYIITSKANSVPSQKDATLRRKGDTPKGEGVCNEQPYVPTSKVQPVASHNDTTPLTTRKRGCGGDAPIVIEEIVESSSPECEEIHHEMSATVGTNSRKPSESQLTSPTNEYTVRLLETIAKLSGHVDKETSRRPSVQSPPPTVIEISSDSEVEEECSSLVVSFDLSKLSRPPILPPCPSLTEVGVITHRLGSFTSQGVQVERGLILDKEVVDSYLTVKVGEALYELKEKLAKTEKKVRQVMKEKDRLEKTLEMKLKLIKDLTTTGLKPVFVDKETMTDHVELASPKKKVRPKLKSVATETESSGIVDGGYQSHAHSTCLSNLSETELEEYLYVNSETAPPSQDEEESVPERDNTAQSTKNHWMFESGDSARCSAFNLQVRFMRALTQNIMSHSSGCNSSVVSSGLLDRQLCLAFAKMERINQHLKALPLVSILREKVSAVTSSISHLLSHLPLGSKERQGVVYEDIVTLMKLSTGGATYIAGWKIKELLTLLAGMDSGSLPTYIKAELAQVKKTAEQALDFGITGVRNVTIDHGSTSRARPTSLEPAFGHYLIKDDYDLDDVLSSSWDDSDGDDEDNHKRRGVGEASNGTSRAKDVSVAGSSSKDGKSRKRLRKEKKQEKKSLSRKSNRKIHHSIFIKRKGGKFAKSTSRKADDDSALRRPPSKRSRLSKRTAPALPRLLPKPNSPSTMLSRVPQESQVSCDTLTKSPPTSAGLGDKSPPTSVATSSGVGDKSSPTSVATSAGVGDTTGAVVPFKSTKLPFSMAVNLSDKNLSEPLRLLTSLASRISTTSSSTSLATPNSFTCPPMTSRQPQLSSVTTLAPVQAGMVNGTVGRVDVTNLSSRKFTPIVKVISSSNKSSGFISPLGSSRPLVGPGTTGPLPLCSAAPRVNVQLLSLGSSKPQQGVDSSKPQLPVSSTVHSTGLASSSASSMPPVGRGSQLPLFSSTPPSLTLTSPPSSVCPISTSVHQLLPSPPTSSVASLMSASHPSLHTQAAVNSSLAGSEHTRFHTPLNLAPGKGILSTPMPLLYPLKVPPAYLFGRTNANALPPLGATPPPVNVHALSSALSGRLPSYASLMGMNISSLVNLASSMKLLNKVRASTVSIPQAPTLVTKTTAHASDLPLFSQVSNQTNSAVPSSGPVVSASTSSPRTAVQQQNGIPRTTAPPSTSSTNNLQLKNDVAVSSSGDLSLSSTSTTCVCTPTSNVPPAMATAPAALSAVATAVLPTTIHSSTAMSVADSLNSPPNLASLPRTGTSASCSKIQTTCQPTRPSSIATVHVTEASLMENGVADGGKKSSPLPPVSVSATSVAVSGDVITNATSLSPTTSTVTSSAVSRSIMTNATSLCPTTSTVISGPTTSTLTGSAVSRGVMTDATSLCPTTSTVTSSAVSRGVMTDATSLCPSKGTSSALVKTVASTTLSEEQTRPRNVSVKATVLTASTESTTTSVCQHSPSPPPPLTSSTVVSTSLMDSSASPPVLCKSKSSSIHQKMSTCVSTSEMKTIAKAMSAPSVPSPLHSSNSQVSTTNTSRELQPSSIRPVSEGKGAPPSSNNPTGGKTILTNDPVSGSKGIRLPSNNPLTSENKVTLPSLKQLTSESKNIVTSSNDPASKGKDTLPSTNDHSSGCKSTLPSSNIPTSGGNSTLPLGVNPLEITPMVQVLNDVKGVLIKWTLPKKYIPLEALVRSYEIYAFIVKADGTGVYPPFSEWSKVGKIQPLKLPMAVTLTNVLKTKKYMFSVRAIFDEDSATVSQFSKPSS